MRFYLYLLIPCILSSLLPFLWQALVLLLVFSICCAFIVTRATDKRLGFWQASLIFSLLFLFLI
ncbi:hypothetical protein NIE88_04410 [Sporolactobacillus shoreicorticis]|uniref:Uncharacterized protein n=1 Tax=Sporolactobacillus shoreicorticis TaxID=1923877 RepID=A0ABW5RYH1_9BACL|nr:hypothetical protein [Sporolactobacillus shoreicorticis]MCO7125016.1 hypothetical protein [Sporolactobacillus shoreicorticis]